VWNSIAASLQKAWDTACSAGAQVYITGHSLGAALALIMGVHHPEAFTWTFAGPAVFSPIHELPPSTNIVRVVNPSDLVPKVPIPPLYQQIGQEVDIAGAANEFGLRAAAFSRYVRGGIGDVDRALTTLSILRTRRLRPMFLAQCYVAYVIQRFGKDAKGKWRKLEGNSSTMFLRACAASVDVVDESAILFDFKHATVPMNAAQWLDVLHFFESTDFPLVYQMDLSVDRVAGQGYAPGQRRGQGREAHHR
jgi:hypothetical protein